MAVYKIEVSNGRFDHVVTKRAAVARAIEMVGADAGTSAQTLEKGWGVRLTRVSDAVARSVGIHVGPLQWRRVKRDPRTAYERGIERHQDHADFESSFD